MFKRKLSALEYPEYDKINILDETEFRKLIVWLEENKIKRYKSTDPNKISNVNSSDWREIYAQYKQDVGCSISCNLIQAEVDWFLQHALELEYSNKKTLYEKHGSESTKLSGTPKVLADNLLDLLDFGGKDFENGVAKLAELLKISSHPDPLITLKAISKVIFNRLSKNALENPGDYIIKGTPFPFQDADLGFDLGDPVLNRAAKILALLYIQDLRQLQTKCNELIVAVQNVTADPKTDTKLGQVGKK